MKKIVQYLLIALGILVVGHETIHPDYRPLGEMDKHIRLLRLEFEPDHKRFFLDARLDDSIAYSLLHRDTLLKLQIEESIGNRAGDPAMQPRLGFFGISTQRRGLRAGTPGGRRNGSYSPENVRKR